VKNERNSKANTIKVKTTRVNRSLKSSIRSWGTCQWKQVSLRTRRNSKDNHRRIYNRSISPIL